MSKSKTDLYKELGVERNASQDEIKKAFRQMAKKWHPDKNPGDPTATAKFQAISHAYSILSDPDKRLKYDKYGTVNEDEWNFEDFMNNCGIDFDELFSIDNFIDISHPNHSLKLMIVKKDKDIKSELKLSNDYIHEKGLNYLIYGKGKGMKSVSNILTETTEENFSDEWEEVKGDDNDSDNDNEEDEEFEEIEDGEAFLEFIDKNTKNVGQKVMCKLCKDKKKYNIKEIDEHFIKTHEKDYNKSEFAETTPWKDAIQSYEESMKDLDLGFDFLMGGKGDKGKGGFEMDGLFEVMMSMGAMGGMPGGKKNKKKK